MSSNSPRRAQVVAALFMALAGMSMAVAWAEWEQSREREAQQVRRQNSQNARASGRAVPPANPPESDLYWSPWPGWVFRWTASAQVGAEVIQVGLLVLGVGLCHLRFHPDGRRDAMAVRPSGPGRIASAIATGAMALTTLAALRSIGIDTHLPGAASLFPRAMPRLFWVSISGLHWVPEAITAAWLYLAVTGQWRRRPEDFVERLGRWLGWAWIGTGSALKAIDVLGMTEVGRW